VRYEKMMRIRGIWILLFALVLPQVGLAQEVAWSVQTTRGWIGISFNYASAVLSGSEEAVAVIEEVAKGSPAEAAGIRVGDTLTHLDGQTISEEVMVSLTRNMEVGDLVRMTILRGERPREVLVEAGPQGPVNWVMAPDSREMVIRLDSNREAILDNLDSLRVSLAGVGLVDVDESGEVAIRVIESASRTGNREDRFSFTYRIPDQSVSDTLQFTQQFFFPSADPAIPFGAFVVGSEETADLRDELRRIRKELTDVRRSELSRLRELQAGTQGPVEELARRDERILELRVLEEALLRDQRRSSEELRHVSEEVMQRRFSEVQMHQEEAQAAAHRVRVQTSEWTRAQSEESYRTLERLQDQYQSRRPLSYITVGQSFVAGAQLTPLNPGLAEYFRGVEEGVLVMEVLDGTPAAEAGMLAGDVIVRVGSENISSLDELRFSIGYFERPLTLRVIRKGSPVVIIIEK
jgi:membrane-associated protease RseP (regulator of RpoE activity)